MDNERDSRTTTLQVHRSEDRDKDFKEEGGGEEEEGDSGKELSKVVSPQKRRRVVIKRSTLRKNADSAPSSTDAESAKMTNRATSGLAPSPKKKKHTTEEISTTGSQTLEPCLDATCIDKSVPLPNNQQESKQIFLLILKQLQ